MIRSLCLIGHSIYILNTQSWFGPQQQWRNNTWAKYLLLVLLSVVRWCCHGFAAAHLLPMPLEVNNTVERSKWKCLRCRWSIKKETTTNRLNLFFVNSMIHDDDDDDPKQSIWTNVFWIMESECHRNAACALCSSDRRHTEHSNVCTPTFCTVIHHVLCVQCCWGTWPVSVYLQPAAAHESPMRLCASWLPSPAHDEVCLASFIERATEIN